MTWTVAAIAVGLLVLSVASGMLGLGVAFAAVPFLGFFMADLVNQVQPLSLILNGVTGMFAAWGFARSGYVKWRPAIALTAVTASVAPFGALLAHYVGQTWLWGIYLLAVAFLAWRLFQPSSGSGTARLEPNLRLALTLAVPISLLAGLLGVGPGFLLMPVLIVVGYEPKSAAGINAVAITLPSFTALIPHMATAQVDVGLASILIVLGAAGSFVGARLTSRFVSGPTLKRLFGVLIVTMTAVKMITLVAS